MLHYTEQRDIHSADALWCTEHRPVYTLGKNRQGVALPPAECNIPIVQTDRGGKITYHGPGQVVLYVLLDLRRYALSVRGLVSLLENATISLLKRYDIHAHAKPDAPGVYVGNAKIAALGLRLKQHFCYHGMSLNVDMDLTPFTLIAPCGYVGLEVTQMRQFSLCTSEDVAQQLANGVQQGLQAVVNG